MDLWRDHTFEKLYDIHVTPILPTCYRICLLMWGSCPLSRLSGVLKQNKYLSMVSIYCCICMHLYVIVFRHFFVSVGKAYEVTFRHVALYLQKMWEMTEFEWFEVKTHRKPQKWGATELQELWENFFWNYRSERTEDQ